MPSRPCSHRRSAAALLAVAAALVGACGAAPDTSPAGASPTPVAARTPGPTGAPDLAALLPERVGDLAFVRSSYRGADVAHSVVSLDEDALEALAGGSLAGVAVAEARPADPTQGGIVLAIRVPGADPMRVVDATFTESKTLTGATMGGKTVFEASGSGLNVVVYPKDDVVFQVLGADDARTEQIVSALP